MKRFISLLFAVALLFSLISCEYLPESVRGLIPGEKIKTASFSACYDYGLHDNGKATLLLDGSVLFFELDEWGIDTILAGDTVTLTYRGNELMIQESYPSRIVTSDIEIVDITLTEAELIELTVIQNPGGGVSVKPKDDGITIKRHDFPNRYVISADMSYMPLNDSHAGTTLYGSIVREDSGAILKALYGFSPRD